MKTLNTQVLDKRLALLESYIPQFETKNNKVSKATIGWQIDHSLKVINAVSISMLKSDPEMYKNNFSFLGKLFLKMGFFPRGKAKAPKYVQPPEIILKEDLINQMVEAKENIIKIQNLDKNAFFKHPLFGHINTTRVIRFMDTHTNHHIKIIKNILQ